MAVQSSLYSGTALESRTFPSTKHIATKQHMAVWRQQVLDSVWVLMPIDEYQLINNACVLNQVLSSELYEQIEIRVADEPDELVTSPSDIALVASIASEVAVVAGISDEVVSVATNEANVNIVAADIDSVVIDAENIDSINTVAAAIEGGAGIGGGQYIGKGLIKGVMFLAQESEENETMVVVSGTNAMSVDSFTVADGSELVIEDGSVYKVV